MRRKMEEFSWQQCLDIRTRRLQTDETFLEIAENVLGDRKYKEYAREVFTKIEDLLAANKGHSFEELVELGNLFDGIRGKKILVIVNRLWSAKLYSPEQVLNASKSDLKKVRGLGNNYVKTLTDIQERYNKSDYLHLIK